MAIRNRQSGTYRLPLFVPHVLICLLITGQTTTACATENVPFEELGGDQCFMFSQLLQYQRQGNQAVELPLELVINNEADYRKLFDPQIMRQSCANVSLSEAIPTVDFSTRTVLAFWNSGSCAATGFKKRVSRDDSQKVITYFVTVTHAEIACRGPGHESLNLVAIPKIEAGYKVTFEKSTE